VHRRVRSPEPTSAFQTRGHEYLIRRGCQISSAYIGLLEGGRASIFHIHTRILGRNGGGRGCNATECRGRQRWRRDARGGKGESMGGWVHDMSCCAWLASTFFQPPQPIVSISLRPSSPSRYTYSRRRLSPSRRRGIHCHIDPP